MGSNTPCSRVLSPSSIQQTCPLDPRKNTYAVQLAMSAMGQSATRGQNSFQQAAIRAYQNPIWKSRGLGSLLLSRIISSKKPANTAPIGSMNIQNSVLGKRCPNVFRCCGRWTRNSMEYPIAANQRSQRTYRKNSHAYAADIVMPLGRSHRIENTSPDSGFVKHRPPNSFQDV
jgi:hypothetical protein